MPQPKSLVAVVMGSKSDWETMRHAVETLDHLGVPNESRVLSAHRTPDATAEFARNAADRGFRVIIAGAGGIAVGTLAIGDSGAKNAALLAAAILATADKKLWRKLEAFRKKQSESVLAAKLPK